MFLGIWVHALGCGSEGDTASTGAGGGATTSSASSGTAGSGGGGSGGAPCIPADDGNPCTDDVCTDGTLANPPKANGTACDDGDACTPADTCQAGACISGNPLMCAVGETCGATQTGT